MSPSLIEERTPRGAKVVLSIQRENGQTDSLAYYTDERIFVYSWSNGISWCPEFRIEFDEAPIPHAALCRLREFKALLTPDILRTIGIAGAVWLDRLIETHAFGGYSHDGIEPFVPVP